MSPNFAEIAVTIGGSLAIATVVKATVISGSALSAARLTRHARASLRHAIFATAFTILLALPVVAMVVPARQVRVALPQSARIGGVANTVPVSLRGEPVVSSTTNVAVSPGFATLPRLSPSLMVFVLWLAGVAIILVPAIVTPHRLHRLRHTGRPWRQGQAIVDEIAAARAVRVRVELLVHEDVAGPMTAGVIRPVLVLPRDARQWAPAALRDAIVHELEHIRRADWLMLCLARVACALYWFHPLVWMCWRRLRLNAEHACDDAVLAGAAPEDYADQLVTLAERLASHRTESVLAMAGRNDLAARVTAVLDGSRRRGPAGFHWISIAGVAAVLLIAGIAPLRAVAVPQASAHSDGHRAAFEVASVRRNIQSFGIMGGDCRGVEGGGTDNSGGGIAAMARAAGFTPVAPGRCRFARATLKELIAYAYAIPPRELERMVVGGPGWIDGDRFDVEAKSETLVPVAEMRLMLQQMLADRFKLRLHREPRQQQGYALVIAPGGPKLQEATGTEPRTGMATIGGGPVTAWKTTMPMLAKYLSLRLGRPVDDQTGLRGIFNFSLSWTPGDDERPRFGSLNVPPEIRERLQSNADQSGTSVFTAVQEQLGLRLVSRQVPGEILVVDAADPPTEN
jgi:uncharacterized protein (TIGR03435 family)